MQLNKCFLFKKCMWNNSITYRDCTLNCVPKCSFDIIIWSFTCFFIAFPFSLPLQTPFLPSPYPAVTIKIIIIISLSGLSPAQAEFNYLNTARTLELYGVELHYARVSKVFFMHTSLHLSASVFVSCWNMSSRHTFFFVYYLNCNQKLQISVV